MLLPKNVERRQWVNRDDRIKVIFNVADENLRHIVLKLDDGGEMQLFFCVRKQLCRIWNVFYKINVRAYSPLAGNMFFLCSLLFALSLKGR